MTKNTMTEAERKALFDEGVARHAHYKTSRARETELARIQVKARVQKDMDDRNIFYAALVDDHGFSIAEIGRIMGTSNRPTMKDAVEAGRALRPTSVAGQAEEAPAEQQKFHWDADAGELTITLTPEDIAPYKQALTHLDEPSENGEWDVFTYDGARLVPDSPDPQSIAQAIAAFPQMQQEAIAFIENEK